MLFNEVPSLRKIFGFLLILFMINLQLDSRIVLLQNDYDRLKKNEQNLSNDIEPLERKVADLEHRLKEQTTRVKSVLVDEKDIQHKKIEVSQLLKGLILLWQI